MLSNFFRRRRESELETALRRSRPEPRSEFLATLAGRVRAEQSAPQRGWSGLRVGFAAGLSAFLLIALAAFGGLGYAANAVHSATRAVTRVIAPSKPKIVKVSAAADQYGSKVKICRQGKTVTINESALAAALNKGATRGACAVKKPARSRVKGTTRRGVSPRTTG